MNIVLAIVFLLVALCFGWISWTELTHGYFLNAVPWALCTVVWLAISVYWIVHP